MDTAPTYLDTITAILTSATGFGGSFDIDYPAGKSASDYAGGSRSMLRSTSQDTLHEARSQFSLAFGASAITVTILAAKSYALGETVYLDLDVGPVGKGGGRIGVAALADPTMMDLKAAVTFSLGAPATADADGAVASQACTAADGLATGINGALASDGVATFDVPRNVVAAWTGTAVLTVTGTDAYGNVMVESSGSGTSLTGKKAFKTITGISTSANITGLTVGTGVVLGLPCYLANKGDVFIETRDGAKATAGTVLAGVTDAATATTGDVRGTYQANSAPNGSAVIELTAMVRDPSAKGVDQYAG